MRKYSVGLLVICLISAGTGYSDAPAGLPIPVVPTGHRMDYSWTFQSLDGVTHSLMDFDGHVLLISYWATWCGPCNAELPNLSRLTQALKGYPVDIFCLTNQGQSVVNKWLQTHPIDLPIYTYVGLPPHDIRVKAWPTTYLVNKEGLVVYQHEGAAQWDDPDVIEILKNMSR